MLEYIGIGATYLLYAFTQASVQVRLGHTFADFKHEKKPGVDLFGFMALAPIVTVFYAGKAIVTKPVDWFNAYAERLAYRDSN